jgi:hypothetical protein
MSGICGRYDFYFSILSFQKRTDFAQAKYSPFILDLGLITKRASPKRALMSRATLSRKNAKGEALAWNRGM